MTKIKLHAGCRALLGAVPCAIALTVFFFADLPIAQAVYSPETAFGWLFDVVSPSIAPSIGLFLLCVLLNTKRTEPVTRKKEMISATVETVLAAVCAWIAVAQFDKYAETDLPTYAIGLIAAVYLLLMLAVTRKIRADRAELQNLVISTLVMILTVLLLTNSIKSIWGRQRFWSMDPALYAEQFTPWLFPQGGGSGDAFRSFPSGHTSNGCAILLITLFPCALPALRKVRPWLIVFVAIWIPLMAFSRMVEGMHFASDVTFGFLIAYLVFTFVSSDTFKRWTAPLAKHL